MKNKPLFIVISFVIVYLSFEFLCFAAEIFLEHFKGIKYSSHLDKACQIVAENKQRIIDLVHSTNAELQFDPVLGWNFDQNYHSLSETITQGIRGEKIYDLKKDPAMVRMLAFGDSFTFSWGVSNKSSWEQVLNDSGKVEVLNFGVPVYGLDQAYLRYMREGRRYQTDYVLIGYIVDDSNRNVNTFRYFFDPGWCYYSKPRFYLENDQLKLMENYFKKPGDMLNLISDTKNVIQSLGMKDYFYQTRFYPTGFLDFLPSVRLYKVLRSVYREKYTGLIKDGVINTNSEAYQVTTRIFDAFVTDVRRNNSIPVIMVFPDTEDLQRERKGRSKRYTALLEYFKKNHYAYFDVMEAFDRYGSNSDLKELIAEHYSPTGNFIVAKGLMEYLLKNHPKY